jgi:hypothetical protein
MSQTIRTTMRRLLANGPLTAMPKRPKDAELVLALAARRFAAGRTYREPEVNGLLEAWLETFSVPYGIDHVSLRGYLVDAQFLLRDTAGSTYRLNGRKTLPEAEVDPAQVLAEMRRERAARKRQHAS